MKKYSLYLFDFDGTLFDTLDSLINCYRLALKKFKRTCTDEECSMFLGMSLPLTAAYKKIDKKYEQDFIDTFHECVKSPKVEKATKLYPETLATFKYLEKHNIKYGIVTGSSSWRVRGILKYFKINTTNLVTIIGNDNYHHPKPHPEPILNALKETGYLNKRKQVVFVGDALQDEKCAKAAQVDSIIVKRINNKKHDIETLLDLFK